MVKKRKKLGKEVFALAVYDIDDVDEVLEKHSFWQRVWILVWVMRFLQNYWNKKVDRIRGPLMTFETEKQFKWWIRWEQERYSVKDKFIEYQQRLNLQRNNEGIYPKEGFTDIILCTCHPG